MKKLLLFLLVGIYALQGAEHSFTNTKLEDLSSAASQALDALHKQEVDDYVIKATTDPEFVQKNKGYARDYSLWNDCCKKTPEGRKRTVESSVGDQYVTVKCKECKLVLGVGEKSEKAQKPALNITTMILNMKNSKKNPEPPAKRLKQNPSSEGSNASSALPLDAQPAAAAALPLGSPSKQEMAKEIIEEASDVVPCCYLLKNLEIIQDREKSTVSTRCKACKGGFINGGTLKYDTQPFHAIKDLEKRARDAVKARRRTKQEQNMRPFPDNVTFCTICNKFINTSNINGHKFARCCWDIYQEKYVNAEQRVE